MSDKRIIEEPASEEIFHDDWLVKDSPLNETTKIQASVFMALVADEAKDGMVPYTMLATEWTALTTYYKDQVVIYNGELYRAKDTNVSPTFNPSAWTKISFDTLYRTTLADVKNSICEEWSTSGEYTLNDCAIHEDKLYKCVADTATVGTWVSDEWELVSIYEIIQNLPKSASDVTYDNTESGLESDNVQDALDEVAETITELSNTTEVTGTASGAIATFTDGADAPLKSLKVAVTPYQDLHGYDAPWAGGAGKNKFDKDNANVFNGYIASGKVTANSNHRCIYIPCKPNTTYTVQKIAVANGDQDRFSVGYCDVLPANNVDCYDIQSVTVSTIVAGALLTLTITTGANASYLILWVSTTTYYSQSIATTQIEQGSTATSYEPYSNICPIIGWDEAVVNVTGINIWDEEWENGIYNTSTGQPSPNNNCIRSKNPIPVKPSTRVYNHVGQGLQDIIRVLFYDINGDFVSSITSSMITNRTLTVPNNCYFMHFYCSGDYGNTYNNDISINYPSTDTSYHAYNGATYTIDLNGTRYGGTLDATNGVLTVDRVEVDMGSLNWYYSRWGFNDVFTVYIDDAKQYDSGIGNIASSIYKNIAQAELYTTTSDGVMCMNGKNIRLINRAYTNASDFKTAMNGVQLVYELATPITVQLSPTAVKSLEGTNNIFANCGDINNVEYVRNLNITINDLLSRING